jgi:hypothetical protein
MEIANQQDKILGLPQYIQYQQQERVDELNDRIGSRYFPDSPLQPNFDPRPIPTKYSLFPIINRRTPLKEPVVPYLDYNVINFNTGSQRAPPSGYVNNIDLENELRNQNSALQHGTFEGVYIPSVKSEIYNVSVPSGRQMEEQPFPNLFSIQLLDNIPNPNIVNSNIGKNVFYNHTRTQLRAT